MPARIILLFAMSTLALVLFGNVSSAGEPVAQPTTHSPACSATPPLQLDLACSALPNTIARGPVDLASGILDYDLFAWNSFIALNWPAVIPTAGNGWKRGYPDPHKNFAGAAHDDLTVWETYKEKREVFLASEVGITPNPHPQAWNAAPQYGPAQHQVPRCPDTEQLPHFERQFVHTTKLFNSLDENVEVPSEARELESVLCQGHPFSADCGVGLSSAAEVGSGKGAAVGPRVWRGQPSAGKPVLYEVKVNWDFYNYLANFQLNGNPAPLWEQQHAQDASKLAKIRLPARTSAAQAPLQPGTGFFRNPNPAAFDPDDAPNGLNPIVTSYSASSCMQFTSPTHPCPQGSVHLKAAWIPLTREQFHAGDYHVAAAYFYRTHGPQKETCKEPAYFGLVGLHIIQRIHEQHFHDDHTTPFPRAHPHGGSFIFASWEHVENDSAGFTYANLYPTGSEEAKLYPNVDQEGVDGIALNRFYTPLPNTVAANAMVHRALNCPGSGSVWCNYRLIGTQYTAADPPANYTLKTALPSTPLAGLESPVGSGQPYFLANLVVESNVGLQQFLGTPPQSTFIPHFLSPQHPPGGSGRTRGEPNIISNPTDDFDHAAHNLAWRIAPRQPPATQHPEDTPPQAIRKTIIHRNHGDHSGKKRGAFNMGGCMGCHGVAQLRGYSFSFVLLGNQAGAIPDTAHIPGAVRPQPAHKLFYAVLSGDNQFDIASSETGVPGSFSFARAASGHGPSPTPPLVYPGPALAWFHGKLYYAVTGTTATSDYIRPYIASSETGTPSSFTFAPADNSPRHFAAGPALASFKGRLYYAATGDDHRPYIASSATGEMGTFTLTRASSGPVPETRRTPALASFGNKLHYAIIDDQGRLYLASSTTGRAGSFTFAAVGRVISPYTPALASFNGKLYIAAVSPVGSAPLIASSETGASDSFSFERLDGGRFEAAGPLALASFGGKLYYAFSGREIQRPPGEGRGLYIASSETGHPNMFTVGFAGHTQQPELASPALAAEANAMR